MRLFNASLEKYQDQCDSLVFRLFPNSFSEVPDHLADFIIDRYKDCGVFKAPYNMSEDQFKRARRDALLKYLGITLRERVANYLAYEDDQRRKGATIIPDVKFERAKRWAEELRVVLEQEAPIEEELSFLAQTRPVVPNTPIQSEENIEAPTTFEGLEGAPRRRRGRPVAQTAEVVA